MYLLLIAPFLVMLLAASIRKVEEGQRAAVLRRGKPTGRIVGPGFVMILPFFERLQTVSIEPFSVSLPPQSAITRDEIPIQLQASLDAHIIDPCLAVGVRDWRIYLIGQLQEFMKEKLEDIEFDDISKVFPEWVENIRKQTGEKAREVGVEITSLEISNLSPRTKPA